MAATCCQTGALDSLRYDSTAMGVQMKGTRRTGFLVRSSMYCTSSLQEYSSISQISEIPSRSRAPSKGKREASTSWKMGALRLTQIWRPERLFMKFVPTSITQSKNPGTTSSCFTVVQESFRLRRSIHQVSLLTFIKQTSCPEARKVSAIDSTVCGEPELKNECWKLTVTPIRILYFLRGMV